MATAIRPSKRSPRPAKPRTAAPQRRGKHCADAGRGTTANAIPPDSPAAAADLAQHDRDVLRPNRQATALGSWPASRWAVASVRSLPSPQPLVTPTQTPHHSGRRAAVVSPSDSMAQPKTNSPRLHPRSLDATHTMPLCRAAFCHDSTIFRGDVVRTLHPRQTALLTRARSTHSQTLGQSRAISPFGPPVRRGSAINAHPSGNRCDTSCSPHFAGLLPKYPRNAAGSSCVSS